MKVMNEYQVQRFLRPTTVYNVPISTSL